MVRIPTMQGMHLDRLDLNLLRALDVLLAERNVTRAAERLGLSQSAASHVLARLRRAFGDPLLVRAPGGMQPTERAAHLAGPLAEALEGIARAVRPPDAFDPARARRTFVVATDDYLEQVLMLRVLPRLWREAPGVDVVVQPVTGRQVEDLTEGRIDVAISVAGAVPPLTSIYTQHLFSERFVCLLRPGHPLAGRFDLAAFASLPHALVAPAGRSGGIVDRALEQLGLTRRVAIRLPHFLAAPSVVRSTDVVLTVGERLARAIASDLVILPPPLELPGFDVALFWPGRHRVDPAQRWFRGLIAEVAREV
jgi:DNA-binding transcriptional LysR family regulator